MIRDATPSVRERSAGWMPLTFSAIGLLTSFLGIVSSSLLGRLLERLMGVAVPHGEMLAAEATRALGIQCGTLVLFLAGTGYMTRLRYHGGLALFSVSLANPLCVLASAYLFTKLRLDVPRGYYPSWVLEFVRWWLWLTGASILGAVLGGSIKSRRSSAA